MSESTSTLVECPVCGEAFDPTAAGGWCTNSDCGEWQHEEANLPTGEGEAAAGTDADAADDDTADRTPTADAEETADEAAEDSASDRAEPADDPTPAIRRVPDAEVEPAADDKSASDSDEQAEITCPGCAETLAADVNFCPSCGEDVSAVDPGEATEELTACPACDEAVGPEASFCPSCGEDLDAHRESTALTACPSCEGDIEPEDSFCPSCGENLDAHREDVTGTADTAAETEETPDSLVLRTRGEELTVEDSDTIGRELRRIVTDTGGEESEAVRIHREHVRFVRDDDTFQVVDLGRNPTRLNDDRLEEGDQEPVEPGDELTLSNVITLAIDEP